jgi:hypothetical protein
VAITRILAPIEWSQAAERVRPALVLALDALVQETDPAANDSFFSFEVEALEAAGNSGHVLRMTHVLFFAARDFLQKPCRRDELQTVALLCNWGYSTAVREYRSAQNPSVRSTRRMRDALVAYAEAADALNDAVGNVLFEGLHAPIEEGF